MKHCHCFFLARIPVRILGFGSMMIEVNGLCDCQCQANVVSISCIFDSTEFYMSTVSPLDNEQREL